MDSQQLIESYIDDVALRLPRSMRNDVGLELRALLTDELAGAAEAAGRPPDAEMTVELLLGFGRPEEVAARYHTPGFVLVEPEHAPLFVRLSLAFVAIQWALTLPAVYLSTKTFAEWWTGWGLGAFWWPGFLITYFAVATWIRRRWPVDHDGFGRPWQHWILWLPVARDWQPVSEQNLLHRQARLLIPLSVFVAVMFCAPASILDFVLPDTIDTSWARYDMSFSRWLLPPIIALIAARIVLFGFAAARERWRLRTEWLRFGLRFAFVALLLWAIFGGDIFASVPVDASFKAWLLIFVLVNVIDMTVRARRELGRVRLPAMLARQDGTAGCGG